MWKEPKEGKEAGYGPLKNSEFTELAFNEKLACSSSRILSRKLSSRAGATTSAESSSWLGSTAADGGVAGGVARPLLVCGNP